MSVQAHKSAAGKAALAHVEDGMRLGIGSGSTAEAFIAHLIDAVADGLSVTGVPTSERTRRLCEAGGVPLSTLDETPALDLTIDGADEIGPGLSLIKGGGGALLREKSVAAASARMIVIADDGKLVETLGAYPLPIECDAFGLAATRLAIEAEAGALGLTGELRLREGENGTYRTDGGHLIIDASFGRIGDPEALAHRLGRIPGVVETGLFLNMAERAVIASASGVRELTATGRPA